METKIIGILNYTPNSFSDGGLNFEIKTAKSKIISMFEQGADLVDIGANSTSYDKVLLSSEEEWDRVSELLKEISPEYGHRLSIDTFYPDNARKAIDLGICMINDVSACRQKKMLELIASNPHVLYVMMYSLTLPANHKMRARNYQDIISFAEKQLPVLLGLGIKKKQIIFDPGIGFSTDQKLSMEVISNLNHLKQLNVPIYIGHSRKSFLELLKAREPSDRDIETLTTSIYMMSQGVNYLRVHNVDIHARARLVFNELSNHTSS